MRSLLSEPRYSAVAASSSTNGKNRVVGEINLRPVATSATIIPTIRMTIRYGRTRRSNDGGTTRGSSGGGSMVMVPRRVAGGWIRLRCSKISLLMGFP